MTQVIEWYVSVTQVGHDWNRSCLCEGKRRKYIEN